MGGAISGFFIGALVASYISRDSNKTKHNNYSSFFLDIMFDSAIAMTCVSLGTVGGTLAGSILFAYK
jgi:hypothetical protein